jgi:hypothetical protein
MAVNKAPGGSVAAAHHGLHAVVLGDVGSANAEYGAHDPVGVPGGGVGHVAGPSLCTASDELFARQAPLHSQRRGVRSRQRASFSLFSSEFL